jgi:hypothetical protein
MGLTTINNQQTRVKYIRKGTLLLTPQGYVLVASVTGHSGIKECDLPGASTLSANSEWTDLAYKTKGILSPSRNSHRK